MRATVRVLLGPMCAVVARSSVQRQQATVKMSSGSSTLTSR